MFLLAVFLTVPSVAVESSEILLETRLLVKKKVRLTVRKINCVLCFKAPVILQMIVPAEFLHVVSVLKATL